MLKATGRLTRWPYLRLRFYRKKIRINSKSTISTFRTAIAFSMKTLTRCLRQEMESLLVVLTLPVRTVSIVGWELSHLISPDTRPAPPVN